VGGASQAEPVPLEGIRERFLPECSFRGLENRKLQFAVLAAAALHGGAEADLLDEVIWWQADDFWQYALFAAIAYIRIIADRAGVPVRQVCQACWRQAPARQHGPGQTRHNAYLRAGGWVFPASTSRC
jgi:hypothetical protein